MLGSVTTHRSGDDVALGRVPYGEGEARDGGGERGSHELEAAVFWGMRSLDLPQAPATRLVSAAPSSVRREASAIGGVMAGCSLCLVT
jgi:hypothetical protein